MLTELRETRGESQGVYYHKRRNVMKSGTAEIHGERGSASL